MKNNKQLVIVLGNDHTNSMGVVQSLGVEGFYVIAFVWGVKTGLLQSSRYTKELYSAADAQGCIDSMLKLFGREFDPIPIIPCCDTAALILEENKKRLNGKFLFGFVQGDYTIKQLQEKNIQVELAAQSGFNIPQSIVISDAEEIDSLVFFDAPFLIKPLMSIEGAKSDITVCNTKDELKEKATKILPHTGRLLLQQYIDKDFEYSILGCAKKTGEVLIPAKEIKLTIFPQKTGLESKAIMDRLSEESLIIDITNIIKTIGYIGVFSVELMHNSNDGKFYFTEINLRNDGAQPFVRKYGFNLPVMHVNDLLDLSMPLPQKTNPGQYLWEMHHFQAWRHHNISFLTWLSDILKRKGFLLTCERDYKPFFKQFQPLVRGFLRMKPRTKEYYT